MAFSCLVAVQWGVSSTTELTTCRIPKWLPTHIQNPSNIDEPIRAFKKPRKFSLYIFQKVCFIRSREARFLSSALPGGQRPRFPKIWSPSDKFRMAYFLIWLFYLFICLLEDFGSMYFYFSFLPLGMKPPPLDKKKLKLKVKINKLTN